MENIYTNIQTHAPNVKFCSQGLSPEFKVMDKPAGLVQGQPDGNISQPQFFPH